MKVLTHLLVIVLAFALWGCGSGSKDSKMPDVDEFHSLIEPQLHLLNEAIQDESDDPVLYYKRAKIYYGLGEFQHALNDINQAIQLDNSYDKFYLLLANIYFSLQKNTLALKAAKQAEQLKSNNPELYILLAEIFWSLNDSQSSETYLNKAIAIAPFHSEIFLLKGKVFLGQKDTVQAMSNLRTALEKDKQNLDVHKEFIKVYNHQKKYDSMMYYIVQARKISRSDAFLNYYEGQFLENKGLAVASESAYRAAFELDTTFYPASTKLGFIEYQKNNLEPAYYYFNQAVKYNPESKDANRMAGELAEKLNKGEEAIGFYENLVKLDTGNVAVKQSLQRLYAAYSSKIKRMEEEKVETVATTTRETDVVSPPKPVTTTTTTTTGIQKASPVKKDSVVRPTTPVQKPVVGKDTTGKVVKPKTGVDTVKKDKPVKDTTKVKPRTEGGGIGNITGDTSRMERAPSKSIE
ncbi:MAG TPA: tetratricopeptide repeat protein [Cytophagaceae bacterium]